MAQNTTERRTRSYTRMILGAAMDKRRQRWQPIVIGVVCVLLLAACSGPGPLPPTSTVTPPTPTPRPTATVVPSATALPRPTPPPTPLPGTKAVAPVGTQNIPLPTAVPGMPPPMPTMGARLPATPSPAMALGPAYRLAFVSGRDGSDDIFTVDATGFRLTNLTHAQKKTGRDSDPQWSPDGIQIAFVSDRDGNADIWVMNIDGSGAKNLTKANAGDDLAPRWSPDSKRIAYTAFRESDADIYTMNRDGSDLQNLTKSPGDDLQSVWSPDSTQLAFVSARNNKPRGLYTAKIADPVNVTAVANPPCDANAPAWSSDGKTIAVVACAGADGKAPVNTDRVAVYSVPVGGGALVVVSDLKTDGGGPIWSPDSTQLAYWNYRDAQAADVVILTLGSGARRKVMTPAGVARDIAWSPDGMTLAFVMGDFAAGQIMLADSTGNPRPLLSTPAANDRQPCWSPTPLP